ncbi:MAG: hypothetical protein MZW92_58830 [Comamonadaceae bacterium]|nr:hypothetical protein [Comamonadaceae bacterium]
MSAACRRSPCPLAAAGRQPLVLAVSTFVAGRGAGRLGRRRRGVPSDAPARSACGSAPRPAEANAAERLTGQPPVLLEQAATPPARAIVPSEFERYARRVSGEDDTRAASGTTLVRTAAGTTPAPTSHPTDTGRLPGARRATSSS